MCLWRAGEAGRGGGRGQVHLLRHPTIVQTSQRVRDYYHNFRHPLEHYHHNHHHYYYCYITRSIRERGKKKKRSPAFSGGVPESPTLP